MKKREIETLMHTYENEPMYAPSVFLLPIYGLGPDVFLNTKRHKNFGSHNGSILHRSEDTKFKVITMVKQGRVLLAKP